MSRSSTAASLVRARQEHAELSALLARTGTAWATRRAAAAPRSSLARLLAECERRLVDHLGEEERGVYQRLPAQVSQDTGALQVALDDHATLRDLIGFLRQGYAAFDAGDAEAEESVTTTLNDLIDLWRVHVRRVDRVIGPLLRRLGEG
ncbi:MAG: hemerythrin domain-containing protein [Acidobacteriota bacterium]